MPRLVDLDKLALEETTIRLEGEEYVAREPSVNDITRMSKLAGNLEDMDPKELGEADIEATKKMIQIIVPDMPDDVLDEITPRQLAVLSELLGEYVRPSADEIESATGEVGGE